MGKLSPNRRCLVFFLTDQLLGRLARAVEGVTADVSPGAVPIAVDRAFRADVLRRNQDKPETTDRAFRISGLIALAPALEGATGLDGRLDVTIDIDRVPSAQSRPLLEPGTWVVVLVGPRSQEHHEQPC